MPKMKTHRSSAKRFKISPNGKIKRRSALLNHFLEKKTSKRKRRLEKQAFVSKADAKTVRRSLGE